MKKIFIPILLSVFLLVSFASSAFAAAIGTPLPQPEEGWQRIKPDNENFTYLGQNQHLDASYYQSKWQTNGSAIKFNFVGSNMRYIMNTWWSNSSNVVIKIDGKEVAKLNTVGKDESTAKIGFEVIGLEFKEHSVEIINMTNHYLILRGIDINDNGEIKPFNPNIPDLPESPIDLTALGGDSKVTLNWSVVKDATSYNLKRSTTIGGPYTTVATNVYDPTYIDQDVVNGTTYYYVVTAINSDGESMDSNEASATPNASIPEPEPNGNRAILTIIMTTGLEKEFDLSMEEVNTFIDWYDAKESGVGPARYGIDKHNNNKGPFSKRIDYVIFKNILSFEVNEYTTE